MILKCNNCNQIVKTFFDGKHIICESCGKKVDYKKVKR